MRLHESRIAGYHLGSVCTGNRELLGRGPKGYERALGLVDSTPFRTYAITVLTPARPSARRLAETAQILATVRLSKPVASKR